VLRGEGQELDREAGVTPVSAHGLLAPTSDQATARPVVHVRPEMVADLHDPRLIISPNYVGRDRRHGLVLPPRYAPARPPTHRMAQAAVVALVTAAAVVPLTLMVAHDAPAAPAPAGAAHTQLHPVAAATARSPRTPRVRPERAGTAPSERSAAHQERSSDRAAARSAQSAAAAEKRAARASSRAAQRSAAQAARATRRSEARAARTATQASG
jgi:hypothetical protein